MSGFFSRVDTVFIPVRDVDRAREWYEAFLGWPCVWSTDSIAAFRSDAGGTCVTLLRHAYPGMEEAEPRTPFVPQGVCFNLFAQEIEAAHEALRARDVPVGPLMDHGGGVMEFLVTDPDGNSLSVVRC
jgi:catechol 2,3-dioxygenase-like lactoylglutathione lyase family enzyme